MRTGHFEQIFITMNADELGKRIRARRQALGIDQRSLAGIAGVSVHALSNLEGGTANPTLAVVNRVGAALGMELIWQVRAPTSSGADVP